MEAALVDSQAGCGIALGIGIYEEGTVPGQSETGRKVDSGRRLTDAALLIDDCDRLRYVVTRIVVDLPAMTTARMILRVPRRCSTIHLGCQEVAPR
jgi:hypothetical protein